MIWQDITEFLSRGDERMRRESGRMEKNTPALETERLILRKFEPADVRAIYEIYSDKDVNRFLRGSCENNGASPGFL